MVIELLMFAFLLLFMFIPTLIAFSRHLKRKFICFWINLLLGWTLIVWIPMLFWSLLSKTSE